MVEDFGLVQGSAWVNLQRIPNLYWSEMNPCGSTWPLCLPGTDWHDGSARNKVASCAEQTRCLTDEVAVETRKRAKKRGCSAQEIAQGVTAKDR